MPKTFDATLKDLIYDHPQEWLGVLGYPPLPTEVLDSDLSTVSSQAGKIIKVLDTEPWLLQPEMQSNSDAVIPRRTLLYGVLAHHREELPIRSVIVLLRPASLSNASSQKMMTFR